MEWDSIKDNLPKNLKISQIAAIPHKSRDYWMILNLAYKLRVKGTATQSVNKSTDMKKAPQHSMFALGNVIPRIIWTMATAPDEDIPFLMSKIDLKDGYWRMNVQEEDSWHLAYVLPKLSPEEPTRLVIPSLQMGWVNSPAFFCAATETIRDLTEKATTT